MVEHMSAERILCAIQFAIHITENTRMLIMWYGDIHFHNAYLINLYGNSSIVYWQVSRILKQCVDYIL
jgi:hypothetical protein